MFILFDFIEIEALIAVLGIPWITQAIGKGSYRNRMGFHQ
jgi:uncharacterized membrane protein YGL010W